MKVEEKLEELGYLIFTSENDVNIGCKYLNNTYIHMTIKNGKLYDFDVEETYLSNIKVISIIYKLHIMC